MAKTYLVTKGFRQRILANARVQDQATLFRPDSATRTLFHRAIHGGRVQMNPQEVREYVRGNLDATRMLADQIRELQNSRSRNPFVWLAQQRQLSQLRDARRQLTTESWNLRNMVRRGQLPERPLTASERLSALGQGLVNYYFNGSPGQLAARWGATLGGIYGASVIADWVDEAMRPGV